MISRLEPQAPRPAPAWAFWVFLASLLLLAPDLLKPVGWSFLDGVDLIFHEAGHSLSRELDELVMHGVLHLCGYDHATVKKVESLIYISEYKRYQSAPGTRLTRRALSFDRRYPLVNRWRDIG